MIASAPEIGGWSSPEAKAEAINKDKFRVGARWRSQTTLRVRVIVGPTTGGFLTKWEDSAVYSSISPEVLLKNYYYAL